MIPQLLERRARNRRRRIGGGFDPSQVSAVTGWLQNTTVGAVSSIADLFNGSNPATASTTNRPTGNADGSMTFASPNCLSWPVAANNAAAVRFGIVAWIKPTSFGTLPILFCVRPAGGDQYDIAFNTNGTLNIQIWSSAGVRRNATSTRVFVAGTKYPLYFAYDGGQTLEPDKLYVDMGAGKEAFAFSADTAMPAVTRTPTGTFFIGAFSTGAAQPYVGDIGRSLFALQGAGGISGGGLITPAELANLLAVDSLNPNFNPQLQETTPQVFNTAATSVTVTLPARNVGDRLVLALTRKSSDTDPIATPSGWTALSASGLVGSASSFSRAYYQDVTAGNVGVTTAVFTGGTSALSCSLIWRVSGCDPTVAPVANGTVQNSNGVSTVNPGALTGPNSGASQRNLWLVYLGTAGQDSAGGATPAVTVFPTGYGNTGTSTTTNASVGNGCGQGWASKELVAGSDDPSAWTFCPTTSGCRALAINIALRGVQD